MTAVTGRKISGLPAAATAEETDYIPGVQVSSGVTKSFLLSLVRKVRVAIGVTSYGPRAAIRLIAGASTTINAVDNAANDTVDVTIDTTLGPSSVAHKYFLWKTFR